MGYRGAKTAGPSVAHPSSSGGDMTSVSCPGRRLAPEITHTVQVELVIGGMTCAACAARVQAKLNKLDGVTASVNLSTERAWVSAPPTVSARDLVGVVEAAGYTADVTAPPGQDGEADAVAADEAVVRRLRRRLTLALVFFVPLTDVSLML